MAKTDGFGDLSIAVNGQKSGSVVTARLAGGITDLRLRVSLADISRRTALQNLAKAINIALQGDFLETELEPAYEAARVRGGKVEIMHRDYIGLGEGVLATFGRFAKSFALTLQGPDPGSPEGRRRAESGESGGMFRGVLDLVARKLNIVQEFEDKVPMYVEQMLDRLESVQLISGWSREEWQITTTDLGLDVHIRPIEQPSKGGGTAAPPAAKHSSPATQTKKKARAKPAAKKKPARKRATKKSTSKKSSGKKATKKKAAKKKKASS